MKKTRKILPAFKTEDDERNFWDTHSPLDYFDQARAKRVVFPNLKPSLKSISIRLPEDMLDELKVLANKRDVPYQSLAKLYLSWGIRSERSSLNRQQNRRVRRKIRSSVRRVHAVLDKPRNLAKSVTVE